jgi:salicylate hydroxylase
MMKHESLVELALNPAINYWMGPDAHAVCYLLKGGGLHNIVLACPDNLPELISTAQADIREMCHFFKDWDPRLRTLLSIVQETSKLVGSGTSGGLDGVWHSDIALFCCIYILFMKSTI